jgi:5-methyltetrahydrofolate--homocysteine methyltransferase
LGAFVVTAGAGVETLARRYEDEHDDYSAIMVKALGDRIAEALAEMMHKKARTNWGYERADQPLIIDDLIKEKYRGIRPAPGYPACPDHTEKAKIWDLLAAEKNTGVSLTESFAMSPGSSVSGLYFAHPGSKYFRVGDIRRDQLESYAQRKGLPVEVVAKWLAPHLSESL